jgi:hypothetical protein
MHSALRFVSSCELKNMCATHFVPTSFAYNVLMLLQDGQKIYTCKHCSLFLRRISHKDGKRKCKRFLPVDQVILFMLQPGAVKVPDIRNLRRFLEDNIGHTGKDSSNFYASFSAVRHMLQLVRLNLQQEMLGEVDAVSCAWWSANGNCTIFSSAVAAKYVRHGLKKLL